MNEVNQDTELKTLPPLANLVVDRAIENANRKLIAGVRNGNNSRPGAKHPDMAKATQDAVAAASAQSAMAVANRGAAWKENADEKPGRWHRIHRHDQIRR